MLEKETGIREGLVWIGIGAIICILAHQFDFGSFHAPGPGFVPILTGLFVSLIGLAMILARTLSNHRINEPQGTDHPFEIGSWSRLIYTAVLLLAYIILIEPVGFVIMTFLLMFGLFLDHAKRNYAWGLFFSTVTTLISYLTFEVWLRCQLPRGLFPWW